MNQNDCPYCTDHTDEFGIKILDLSASTVYLFREQSHRGRVIVASKYHVSELIDLPVRERQEFMEDVAKVASALRKLFNPAKINYGAYGDKGCHLHFHLVPKYADDEFEWGGVFAMDPKRKYLEPAEYDELVAMLSAELYLGKNFDFRKALIDMHRDIKADGKVDFRESAFLLKALAPMEGTSAVIAEFVKVLRSVREDGVITPEESAQIIKLLDELLA